ncbi:MAG: hypothetical protein MHM6MM_003406 [Cercozoa sp. M6MM]
MGQKYFKWKAVHLKYSPPYADSRKSRVVPFRRLPLGFQGPRITWKMQHQAKEIVRQYYAIKTNDQLKKIAAKALKKRNARMRTFNFIDLLERRLMTMVYKFGAADSMWAARKVVVHGHVRVNGEVVRASSHIVQPGDVVRIDPRLPLREKFARRIFTNVQEYLMANKYYVRPHPSPPIVPNYVLWTMRYNAPVRSELDVDFGAHFNANRHFLQVLEMAMQYYRYRTKTRSL